MRVTAFSVTAKEVVILALRLELEIAYQTSGV